MKTSVNFAATRQNVSKNLSVTILLIVTLIVSIAANTKVSAASQDDTFGPKKSKITLTEQISQYINVDKMDVSKLNSGIVIISFTVNKYDELTNVVSHSQIPELDSFLTQSLEGKTVQTQENNDNEEREQYVKIRFTIDE